jgi:hypothetical protein
MSLSTRMDRLEAALRGRDGGDLPDEPWICRRLIYRPFEWECEEDEADELSRLLVAGKLREIDRERISRMKTDELDRLVAAGEIREMDRECVRFIVRIIVRPLSGPMIPCQRTQGEGAWRGYVISQSLAWAGFHARRKSTNRKE